MSLDKIFLAIVVIAILVYATLIAFAMVAMMPWGIVGLAILAFAGYVGWRIVSDHVSDDEDRYYEDNFDR